MTRINAGILPQELPDKLLLAELREIKRLANIIHKAKIEGIPEQFTLGKGHVKFFYDKGEYTFFRYCVLFLEAKKRGFNVQNFTSAWRDYPEELFNDWTETPEARNLIINRIRERGFELINPAARPQNK